MSIPSVRTWCQKCLIGGHRCQAQIFVEKRPFCLPCADGEPCSYDRVAAIADLQADEEGLEKPTTANYAESSLPAWGYRRKLERQGKLRERAAEAPSELAGDEHLLPEHGGQTAPREEETWLEAEEAFSAADDRMLEQDNRLSQEIEAKIRADISHMTIAEVVQKYEAYR